jgi:predicted transcriptional regulator
MSPNPFYRILLGRKKFFLVIGLIVIFSGIYISKQDVSSSTEGSKIDINSLNAMDYQSYEIIGGYNCFIESGITADVSNYNELLITGSCFIASSLILDIAIIVKKNRKIRKDEAFVASENLLDSEQILNQEEIVLRIVQEYLSKNRFLEMEKIIPFINSRLIKDSNGLNSNGVNSVLNNLVKNHVIVNGSKYTREELLINANRVTIYETIINNPGIHFMRLVTLLGMSKYLAKWHLNMLLKFNLIKKKNVENREIYFTSDIDPQKAEVLHFISREKTQKIIEFLNRNKEYYSKHQLTKKLRMHYNTLTKYLEKLEEYGYIFSLQHSNKKVYSTKASSVL